jgi:hypothetical protein
MISIVEVFYQPGKLFEKLPERPHSWAVPTIADMLVLVASTAAVTRLVGLETIMRQRLQNSNMSPEQMQRALDRMASPAAAYLGYAGAAVSAFLTVLVIAGALAIFAMMTQGKPKFAVTLSMVSLAMLPYWLITFVMSTLVILASPERTSLDFTNLLATNIGAFLDKANTSKWLYSVASSFDLVSFVGIGMLGYGFSKITRSGLASGWGAVLALWLLVVISKAMVSSLF